MFLKSKSLSNRKGFSLMEPGRSDSVLSAPPQCCSCKISNKPNYTTVACARLNLYRPEKNAENQFRILFASSFGKKHVENHFPAVIPLPAFDFQVNFVF
jgi:hypothetical protein